MNTKEQIIQEIEQIPEPLLKEVMAAMKETSSDIRLASTQE